MSHSQNDLDRTSAIHVVDRRAPVAKRWAVMGCLAQAAVENSVNRAEGTCLAVHQDSARPQGVTVRACRRRAGLYPASPGTAQPPFHSSIIRSTAKSSRDE